MMKFVMKIRRMNKTTKELDLKYYFGFGGYTAEEEAYGVEFSEELYQRIKEIYQACGETNLESILQDEELSDKLKHELSKLIAAQKEELIEVQHDNGDD